MQVVTFLLAITAFCQAVPDSDDEAINHIYSDVILADYDNAISLTKDLESMGRGDVISQAVDKLITESKRNVMDFANQLWNHNTDIVKNRFPSQIGAILGASTLKLVALRDNMVMKLGVKADKDGDRIAYGDNNHSIGDRMVWRINPISDPFSDKLHFYIYNVLNNQFLKLGTSADSSGEHSAYGSSGSVGNRKEWYLVPTKLNGAVVFYIVNREYQQALKMGRAVDSYGDRRVYSEASNVFGKPERFGWIISPL